MQIKNLNKTPTFKRNFKEFKMLKEMLEYRPCKIKAIKNVSIENEKDNIDSIQSKSHDNDNLRQKEKDFISENVNKAQEIVLDLNEIKIEE